MKNANDYGCNNTYNIQNKCRRTFSQKTAKHYFPAFHAAFFPFQTCNHVPSRSFSTFFPSFDDFTKILFLSVLLHYLKRGKYWT